MCVPVIVHCLALMRGHVTAFIGNPVRIGPHHTLHQLALRVAAAYMFVAALQGQTVRAFHVQVCRSHVLFQCVK